MQPEFSPKLPRLTVFVLLAVVVSHLALFYVLSKNPGGESSLRNIEKKGVLRVLTRNTSTAYYDDRDQPAGPEYDLVKGFADHLGVKIRLIVKDSIPELFDALGAGEGDLIAAAITRTERREADHRFGPDYQSIQQQLVCREDILLDGPEGLVGRRIAVIAGSSYEETLRQWKRSHPEIAWTSSAQLSTDQMIEQVDSGELDCTLSDSNIVAVNQRFYPRIRVLFAASEPQSLAWVLPAPASALQRELEKWFESSESTGFVASVMEQYYGHVDLFDHFDLSVFRDRIQERLPRYRSLFEEAEEKFGFPWTLLAAQSYQESHWDPKSKSPTGVRGLMMLTRTTAKSVGVKDRLNPRQSVLGGARYLQRMIRRLPDTVTGEDRLYLGLAAYNVGMGHLMDARGLAISLGKNPDSWSELKEILPLLSDQTVHRRLKHGFARGTEPVRYVTRIKNYLDVLNRELNAKSGPVEQGYVQQRFKLLEPGPRRGQGDARHLARLAEGPGFEGAWGKMRRDSLFTVN